MLRCLAVLSQLSLACGQAQPAPLRGEQGAAVGMGSWHRSESESRQEGFHRLLPSNPVCKYLSHLLALLSGFLAQEIFLLCNPD